MTAVDMESQVIAEVLKALTITGPIGIMLGFAVWKLWAALVDERAFSRDLHGQTIKVIADNTAATQQQMRTMERLENAVDELRRGIGDARQH